MNAPKAPKRSTEKADLNNAAEVLTGLENTVQPHSIRDTIRLGKYNPSGRPRPLLVTLNRSSDVNSILLQRSKLKSPFVIKPDLSREARATESHLLNVRWSLMQKNVFKSDIQIRGNKIYVKGKLHGQAESLGFSLNDSSCGSNGSTSHQNMDFHNCHHPSIMTRPPRAQSLCKTAGAWQKIYPFFRALYLSN